MITSKEQWLQLLIHSPPSPAVIKPTIGVRTRVIKYCPYRLKYNCLSTTYPCLFMSVKVWVIPECLARWSQQWVAEGSFEIPRPAKTGINLMKQFAHFWLLPCYQFVEIYFHISSLQNITYCSKRNPSMQLLCRHAWIYILMSVCW